MVFSLSSFNHADRGDHTTLVCVYRQNLDPLDCVADLHNVCAVAVTDISLILVNGVNFKTPQAPLRLMGTGLTSD
ncbi:hypothetical protein CEK28_08855 [Xenophilus sp. AP218F]|nr:hypothetical protein CEK28_08855 [Xenophilus sp. AP218F]